MASCLRQFCEIAYTFLEKLHLKPSYAAFRRFYRGNIRPEVVSDVISGANTNVGQGGVDVPVNFAVYSSNGSRDK